MLSNIEKITLYGFNFYIKRDDKLGIINGNKARKLAYFLAQTYPKNQRFISFGGTQSNAMAALSVFCSQNDFKLIFACNKISSFLKENPCGNFALGLENKVEFKENLSDLSLRDFALSLKKNDDIFIEQGVMMSEAMCGYEILANEIREQSANLGLDFDIFLPSGTGTSAAFLAKSLSECSIFTTPCVGDKKYLLSQISSLVPNLANLFILENAKKYHFAKPNADFIKLYQHALKECKIEFDLLYDMCGLLCVLSNQSAFKKPLLYIHQGGISANSSMLERYKFHKLL